MYLPGWPPVILSAIGANLVEGMLDAILWEVEKSDGHQWLLQLVLLPFTSK
jgi:hypothetical protein